jgi:hypothetical protein
MTDGHEAHPVSDLGVAISAEAAAELAIRESWFPSLRDAKLCVTT